MSEEFFKAIKEGNLSKVEQETEKNPDFVHTRDSRGMSPVVAATYFRQPVIANLLIAKGAQLDIFESSMAGRKGIVESQVGADPNLVNSFSEDGFTPLHLAVFFCRDSVAEFLIARGADVNAIAKNNMKVTPLHSAAAGGSTKSRSEICELLLKNGAHVNARQEGGFTALHSAAQNGDLELARVLVSYGAEVNSRTEKGKTPLDLTNEEGEEAGPKENREKVARFLREKKDEGEK